MTRRSAEAQAVAGQWDEIRQWQAEGRLPPGPITPAIVNHWEQLNREAHGEIEALAYASRLTPADTERFVRIEQAGGPTALAQALIQTGMSRQALSWVADRLEESGGTFAGLRQNVQGRLAEVADQNRTAFIQQEMAKLEAQEGDSPEAAKLKEQSPLVALERDPEVQKQAAAVLAEHGIALKPGETPLRTLHGLAGNLEFGNFANSYRRPRTDPKYTEAQSRLALEAVTGVKNIGPLLDELQGLDERHELASRLAKRDAERQVRFKIADSPERAAIAKHSKQQDSRRAVLEKEQARLEAEAPARAAPARREAPARDTVQKKAAPILRHEALERAADDLGLTDDDGPQSTPDSSLHGVLSREYDRLESEPEEANV